jgi:tetratricopeptide (TPR) repeat protein
LSDVDRLLAGNPGNREGLDLKKVALYRQGKNQLAQRRYDESYQTLTYLAKLQPDYEDTSALLRQARERLSDQRYSEGIRRYRDEKLAQAIAQWRSVLEVDPQHAGGPLRASPSSSPRGGPWAGRSDAALYPILDIDSPGQVGTLLR